MFLAWDSSEWLALTQAVTAVGLLVATVFLAVATRRYTRATEGMAVAGRGQAEASRAQATAALEQARAAQHRPYVHLFLHSRADTLGLRNIGDRVAHNVEVEVHQDAEREPGKGGFLSGSRLFGQPVVSLAPGDEVKESRGNTWIRGSARDLVFDVTLRYEDGEGNRYQERVRASLGEAAEWIPTDPPFGPSREEARLQAHMTILEEQLERIANAVSRSR